jgi:formate dehydrogenase major subunit
MAEKEAASRREFLSFASAGAAAAGVAAATAAAPAAAAEDLPAESAGNPSAPTARSAAPSRRGQNGVWIGQEPGWDSPFNLGAHCAKGAAVREHAHGERRLKYPMKKVGGEWKRISWERRSTRSATRC